MKFARIEMLFLIWTVPVLFLVVLYGMKRRRRILTRFASARALKTLIPNLPSHRRWLKAGLVLAAAAFLSLALAGPQYGFHWQEIEQKGVDLMIALDCSKSMLARDIQPTRLDRAKREVYDLLSMLQGDRVGLIAFSGTAFLQCPLTLDYQAFHLFLSTLTPDTMPVGGTDIEAAVRTALAGFDPEAATEKAVILITDGEHTGRGDPIQAAEAARDRGIKVFCIGVGSRGGVPVPNEGGGFKKDPSGGIVVTRLDEETLQKIAVLTGGTYVRSVAGDMDLDVIYTREILGKMERSTLTGGRKQVWEDRYQWALLLAVMVLVIEMLLKSTRPKTGAVVLMVLMCWPGFARADALREGVAAYERGAYEEALKLFIDAQLDDPDNPKILYNMGNAYYRLEDYENAVHNFRLAQEKGGPELKHKARYNLGNAEFRRQAFQKAIDHYQAALELAPDDLDARQNIEFVKKVMEQQKQQEQQQQQKTGDQNRKESKKSEDEKQTPSSRDQQGDPPEERKQEETARNQPSQDQGAEPEPTPDASQESSEGEDRGEKETAGEKPEPSEPSESPNEKTAASGEKNKEQNSAQSLQADRILNRLQDQPGKAMIPFYGQPKVEKDW